jgi:hypothetical protein
MLNIESGITLRKGENSMADHIELGNGNDLIKAIKTLQIPEHIPTGQNCKYLQKKEERENDIHEQNLNVQNS